MQSPSRAQVNSSTKLPLPVRIRLKLWLTISVVVNVVLLFGAQLSVLPDALVHPSGTSKFHQANRSQLAPRPGNATADAFERIYNLTYSLALQGGNNKPAADGDSPKLRQFSSFNLSEWNSLGHSGGGLSDWDRIKLADIYSQARSVFEYGLGESTKLAAHVNVPRYSGIDSDANWVATARDGSPDYFRFSYADVGALRGWGMAKKSYMTKNYLNYQVAPLFIEKEAFDVYMIDGRWRVACALVSMLHASSRGDKEARALFLIHDFLDKVKSIHCEAPANCNVQRIRMPYHRVKEVADMIDHSGNKLAVFRRRLNVSDDEIYTLWEEMMNVPG